MGSTRPPALSDPCRALHIHIHTCRECPQNPANREAQARLVDPPLPAAILAGQREAGVTRVPGGLVPALAACLEAQQGLPAGGGYVALLCSGVEHYQGEAFDGGWGEQGRAGG